MNDEAFSDARAPVVIACAAPYGVGGMGRHLLELAEHLRGRKIETTCFAVDFAPGEVGDRKIAPIWLVWARKWTPMRFNAAWQGYFEAIVFDAALAKRLPAAKTLVAFNGQCVRSFRAARKLGYERLFLVAATPHVNLTVAQALKAWKYAPVEPLGYIRRQHEQFLFEYELADQIFYASDYVRESFLKEKFPGEKLRRFSLTPQARFKPAPSRKADGRFRVVSVGSLNLVKGVVVLLDAFGKLETPDAELTLVGGSGTRQMRRFLEQCVARDGRIRIAPGDPLPHLQAADVCAHAAFQDGFAYAPMEALACGTPVVVTDHTGMKERVREGVNGYIVPAGNPDALAQALGRIQKGELRGAR